MAIEAIGFQRWQNVVFIGQGRVLCEKMEHGEPSPKRDSDFGLEKFQYDAPKVGRSDWIWMLSRCHGNRLAMEVVSGC
jgi:hypothetical protein